MKEEGRHTFNGIRKALKEKENPKKAQKMKRFFKEDVFYYGVERKDIAQIAKESYRYYKKNDDFSEAFKMSEKLFSTGIMEEATVAVDMLKGFQKKFDLNVFKSLDKWIDYISNWAQCDSLCMALIGPIIFYYNSTIEDLMRWAESENLWRRRASAVSLIYSVKKGRYLEETFKLAKKLMYDKEDMVQKGVGWLLKEAGGKFPERVADFLLKHRNNFSRLVLRYSCEKLPLKLKNKILSK
ncbi:MAG: DNA alkylation repair protein [Acidobacteriota bacterium]